ncbi:MAG: cyclic nucleotide-binding domain-containing protein, partial [Candidatus Latescibacteria bacterium]|nr:cyclic nucleotide-binding domain-containing protein [Candidatus Latescibacterota bacterium]
QNLFQLCKREHYTPGQVLCEYGGPSQRLFVLAKGKLEVLAEDGGHLADIAPISAVGEVGFITRKPRSATVRAKEPSAVLALDGSDFEKLVSQDVELRASIYRNAVRWLAEKLCDANDMIVHYRRTYEPETTVAALRAAAPAAARSSEAFAVGTESDDKEEANQVVGHFYQLVDQQPSAARRHRLRGQMDHAPPAPGQALQYRQTEYQRGLREPLERLAGRPRRLTERDFVDIGTLIGTIALAGAVVFAGHQGFQALYSPEAIALVVVGTVAWALISYPLKTVVGIGQLYKNTFYHRTSDPHVLIRKMVAYAEIARREGILALEQAANEEEDPFLAQGVRLAVDGIEPNLIMNILETELRILNERHRVGQDMLFNMGETAPPWA